MSYIKTRYISSSTYFSPPELMWCRTDGQEVVGTQLLRRLFQLVDFTNTFQNRNVTHQYVFEHLKIKINNKHRTETRLFSPKSAYLHQALSSSI